MQLVRFGYLGSGFGGGNSQLSLPEGTLLFKGQPLMFKGQYITFKNV